MRLVGIDPGLAAFGCAVVEIHQELASPQVLSGRVISVEVWRTKKAVAARNIRKADDTSDRARELARQLLQVITPDTIAICVEAAALPFRKVKLSVVSNLGRIRGLVDAAAALHNLPIIEETPQKLKQMLTGSAKSSKAEMLEAIEKRFPGVEAMWPKQTTLHEHAADSLATIVAGLESDIVRAAIRGRAAATSAVA